MATITQVEWSTPDHIGLRDFLSGVFGWQFAPFGDTYFISDPKQSGIVVGVNRNDRAVIGGGTPNVYIGVKSIDEVFATAQALGGEVAVPKVNMGSGSFAFIKAPDGNMIGLFETGAT
jgi:predicted enzyme related to lactoylglutathione lyase